MVKIVFFSLKSGNQIRPDPVPGNTQSYQYNSRTDNNIDTGNQQLYGQVRNTPSRNGNSISKFCIFTIIALIPFNIEPLEGSI